MESENANERTSPLPDFVRRGIDEFEDREHRKGKRHWDDLSQRTQNFLDFAYAFFNSAWIGAVLVAVIGLVSSLAPSVPK